MRNIILENCDSSRADFDRPVKYLLHDRIRHSRCFHTLCKEFIFKTHYFKHSISHFCIIWDSCWTGCLWTAYLSICDNHKMAHLSWRQLIQYTFQPSFAGGLCVWTGFVSAFIGMTTTEFYSTNMFRFWLSAIDIKASTSSWCVHEFVNRLHVSLHRHDDRRILFNKYVLILALNYWF